MNKEISDIVAAFRVAQKEGRQTALATIVHVEGSSYRLPGARMLVDDKGCMTGAISGGCLEGNALRKALQAINEGKNKLVTYNTEHEDDVEFGVQLGCNGIVHILFEPILPGTANNVVDLLAQFLTQRRDAVLVTLFSLQDYHGHQPGTCYFTNGIDTWCKPGSPYMNNEMSADATAALREKSSVMKEYSNDGLNAFVELLQPPVALVIVGAGNDAIPLAQMAALLGWQITVVDGRHTHAKQQRFPMACQIITGTPAEAIRRLAIDERTVIVLMTHNYNYDKEMMSLLGDKCCRYIGALGPKKRLDRMMSELRESGLRITEAQRASIYGPVGLDIGAEPAEEIALSILAEIKAVLAGRAGSSLRDRKVAIHAPTANIF